MSKLWDDLKKNMKDWSSVAVEKAEEVSKIAVAKTEELTKISKIKIDIHQLTREQNRLHENLGRLVYNQAKNENVANFTGNKEFFGIVEQIDEIQDSTGVKEEEIKHIRKQYNIPETDIPERPDEGREKAEEKQTHAKKGKSKKAAVGKKPKKK